MRKKTIVKVVVFVLLGVVLLSVLSDVVTNSGDYRIAQYYGSFYAEKKNTLDAVYIGPSHTYAAWLAPLAWEHYGIAVHPFNCPNQPFEAAEYIIKEARKTQPDALYIVPFKSINGITSVKLHYLVDAMPLSWNKIQLVNKMGNQMGIGWTGKLEYLFPFIRYHSRWSELEERDFYYPLRGLKGSSYYTNFLRTSTDVSSGYITTERTGELSDFTQNALDSLLEYCDAEQLNVLFVEVPNVVTDENKLAQYNTIKETVQAHGYPVLDLRGAGLDLTKDYYNEAHTNIHGAVKITDYLSQYLVENYGFEDKRGDPVYSSWDEAYDKYTEEYASVYTLDVEWEREPRDSALAAPSLAAGLEINGTSLTVSWEAVAGADGYRVYRKTGSTGKWSALDTLGAEERSYTDTGCKVGKTYVYTVIAYREEDGVRYWGDYDFQGVSGEALLNVSELLSMESNGDGVVLTWSAVDGADHYRLYRKLPGESWEKLVDLGKVTTYTDKTALPGTAYQYRARGLYVDSAGSKHYGSFDKDGSLYLPALDLPQVTLEIVDGVPKLSWEKMQGISGYRIYRHTPGSDWWQLCTALPNTSTSFRDIIAQADTTYYYKVVPYISHKGETYTFDILSSPECIQSVKTVNWTAMPQILSLEQIGGQIVLVWEEKENVNGYCVQRRVRNEDGSWSAWGNIVSSTADTVCLDQPDKAGEYQYRIRVLFVENGITYYGDVNSEGVKDIRYTAK